jgi:hypothetical protein
MAGDDTASLIVALSAQVSQFQKDLDNAAGIADKSAKQIEDRFSRIDFGGEALGGFIEQLKALATGGVIGEIFKQVAELNQQVAEIGDGAERVGLTTDQFQSLRYAVVATGGSVQQADSFMDRFANSVAQAAKGQGDLYNFLRVNNVALKDAQGNLLPTNTLLGKYADLVKNTASPQQQLNEAIMVGGRQAGPALVSVLKEGSDGLEKFGVDAQNAGVILDKDLIDQAKRAAEQFNTLKLQSQTTMEKFAVDIANAIKDANEQAKRDQAANAQLAKEQWQSVSDYVAQHPIIGNILYALSGGSLVVSDNPSKGNFQGGASPDNRADLFSQGKLLLRAQGQSLGSMSGFPGYPSDETNDKTTQQYNAQAEAFQKLITAQEQRVKLLQAENATVGQTVYDTTYLTEKIKLEAQARQQNNNQPLSSNQLSQIDAEAQKIAAATQALDDHKKAWQGVNSAAQFAGDQFISAMDGLRTGTLSASDAIAQLTNSLSTALEQAVLLGSGPLAGVLGTQSNLSGGTGGIIGSLLSSFLAFDDGGYTGAGGKYQPAGIVHKGEVVWSQDDIRRAGGLSVVEALRRNGGIPGYADGGIVMPVPAVPSIVPATVAPRQETAPSYVIQQEITNNFSAGINGTDRAWISQQIDQSSQQTRALARQDAKNQSSRRSG